ncbi:MULTISPECIES: DEAD/DEAH box helicase [Hydrocarboniphaga]|uniref:DEAD/DEAH box helicase n=1 Tax=Hydrocarboniphaga TaxID=243627 RepID=UPI002ABC2DF3|nr:DEAD/DEAH box helicase [Hydrocarboniphaga sp.]MDZ4080406.1 DEAD/DEAH box helicase [Hydrocarboniphaga sp.]
MSERDDIEQVEAVPRAVLTLCQQAYMRTIRQHTLRATAAYARLSFDYGGWRISAEGDLHEMRHADDGHDIQLRRSRSLENEAREALEHLRLTDARLISTRIRPLGPGFVAGDYVFERAHDELADADHWLVLLPRLSAAGFKLEFDAAFPYAVTGEPDAWRADVEHGDNQWFDLSLGIDVDGQRVDLLPILRKLIADPDFPLRPMRNEAEDAVWLVAIDARRRVPLRLSRLRGLLEPLLEWLDAPNDSGRLRLSKLEHGVLDKIERNGVLRKGGEDLRQTLETLRANAAAADAPPGFNAQLRPYQREGLGWLNFLAEAGIGGILADDMGLGKTVQVLAHLLSEKQRGRIGGEAGPALVICPTSLVGNWRAEAQRFAPDLRVLVLHGNDRKRKFKAITHVDLVISTYPLLGRDREALAAQRFALLILDEAQAIKNARTLAAKAARTLRAKRRLSMTGTPMENHLGELWAQFDLVEPGLLGDEKRFVRHYRTPIEKHGDAEVRDKLNRRIAPLMLRRRKEDVLLDLPPKTEIQRLVELEGRQRELYETLRLAQHERVREVVSDRGVEGSGIIVLDALLKLRQVCCDPRLVKLEGARRVPQSAKLDLLLTMLQGVVDEGRRVLVFSQFTEMLDIIAEACAAQRIEHLMLTGQTRDREAVVARFQNGEAPVFLISLKAGGMGLNLTAADTVIHYDPWWNPAVESQATDRAYRIGQDKPVFVYRLICAGTVEEKIQALQARKAELARAVFDGGATSELRFDEADLEALFSPL